MHKKAIAFGLFAGLLFGISTPISKLLLSSLNSYTVAGFLYFGAALVFAPYIVKNYQSDFSYTLLKTNLAKLLGIIVFGGILGPLFLLLGLKSANSMSVSIWLNFELIATAVLGVLFFKEHLSFYGLMGVLLTLVAGIIISLNESATGLQSGVFIVLACFCWGIDNHLTAVVDGIPSQATTFIKGFMGGLVNITLGWLLFNEANFLQYNIVIALLLGMFSYGISIVLYISSAQILGATRGQILFSVSPFWGIAGAAVLLAEPINLTTVFALLLLVGGIFFSNKKGHAHPHKHISTTHIHHHHHGDGHHFHAHEGEHGHGRLTHIHIHTHEAMEHEHDHFPDLHHRHEHSG